MRLEYKYLIPVSEFQNIKDKISPYLALDKNIIKNNFSDYTVRSLYFDTPKLKYYIEKVEGIKVRKKVRIRVYDNYSEDTIAFLEIKRKNENYVSKSRAPLLYRDLESLFRTSKMADLIISNNQYGNTVENAKKFLFYYIHDNLQPTSLITYEREAYFSKFNNNLRITFDKNLRFLSSVNYRSIFEEKKLKGALKDKIIIEIKFNHSIPVWLRNIIIKYELNRTAVSKYVICMDEDKEYDRTSKFKNLRLSNLDLYHPSLKNNILNRNA